jgi:glycosyltransferase involved in cell wall biosynthesis
MQKMILRKWSMGVTILPIFNLHFFTLVMSMIIVMGASFTNVRGESIENETEKRIVIVTCSYNNARFCEWNLDSVRTQQYGNWHLIYMCDGASVQAGSDGTDKMVRDYIAAHNMQDKVTLICNQERCGAMANLYKAIHMCSPTDIIAVLDGDDRFAHDQVLARVNQEYQNPDVWLTYGQYREYSTGRRGFCEPMPARIIEHNAYRSYTSGPSHLRTFYAGLFHKIEKEDLEYAGEFLKMTYDLAMMYPMMEMAGSRFAFIPDILVDYNDINPINDHKVSKDLQRMLDMFIRGKEQYQKLERLFN